MDCGREVSDRVVVAVLASAVGTVVLIVVGAAVVGIHLDGLQDTFMVPAATRYRARI